MSPSVENLLGRSHYSSWRKKRERERELRLWLSPTRASLYCDRNSAGPPIGFRGLSRPSLTFSTIALQMLRRCVGPNVSTRVQRQNIVKTSSKHRQNSVKTSSKHRPNIVQTSSKHRRNIIKTSSKHRRNIVIFNNLYCCAIISGPRDDLLFFVKLLFFFFLDVNKRPLAAHRTPRPDEMSHSSPDC